MIFCFIFRLSLFGCLRFSLNQSLRLRSCCLILIQILPFILCFILRLSNIMNIWSRRSLHKFFLINFLFDRIFCFWVRFQWVSMSYRMSFIGLILYLLGCPNHTWSQRWGISNSCPICFLLPTLDSLYCCCITLFISILLLYSTIMQVTVIWCQSNNLWTIIVLLLVTIIRS